MRPVRKYTFENFIPGKANQLAFCAAKAAAENPGASCNPLFIYGRSGLGKTHLLNAVCNRIRETAPGAVVSMNTAEELVSGLVHAIKEKQTDAWREKTRSADVLLIDDAHILIGKNAAQNEIVSLIRYYVGKRRQVVMTASADPETLPALESSLRSDFDQCLLADIQPPDTRTSRLIARDKAARCGLSLSGESLDYIAAQMHGEVRRLEGIICRLHAQEALAGADIDLSAVKQACADYTRDRSEGNEAYEKTAYIMIGIQGSGKSEFCRRFLPDVERINLDTLRTRKNELKMISACHIRGVDYVVDNTNPTKNDRARYISAAKLMGYRVVGYFMQSRLKECIARNNRREGKEVVPAKAIAMTSNRLELPDRAEGFDELYFVANDGTEMKVSEWRESHEI